MPGRLPFALAKHGVSTFAEDASGHEHKGKGEGGGQFTGKGGGGKSTEDVEIHDPKSGEVYWHGPRHEAETMLKEEDKENPGHGLQLRPTGSGSSQKSVTINKQPEKQPEKLPEPSDWTKFETGKPIADVNIYRGESKEKGWGPGGGGLAALGAGRYYGLEPSVAERFSKEGTVKAGKASLQNPIVIKSDEDMKAIKQQAEKETGKDFGRKGNLYSGLLFGDQVSEFTDYLKSKGHDGLVTTYQEAPGGRQLLIFDTAKHSESFAERDVALAGHDGLAAERLLDRNVKLGTATLGSIAEDAVRRLVKAIQDAGAGEQVIIDGLFTDEERNHLAAALAAACASADLLGRARIRRQLAMHRERDKDYESFREVSELPTSFAGFPESLPPHTPLEALRYFLGLEPTLGVDPQVWGPAMERHAFTLAVATEKELLERVQDAIAGFLTRDATKGKTVATVTFKTPAGTKTLVPEAVTTRTISGVEVPTVAEHGLTPSGYPRTLSGKRVVQALLDEAGVAPDNAVYSEMVWRTNALDAYNTGATRAMQEVADDFPAWKYNGIEDGRERPAHHVHFGKYFPVSVPFVTVRDSVKGSWDGANCRCTPSPVYKTAWLKLQAKGASFSSFAEQRTPSEPQALDLPDIRQPDDYSCWACAAASCARFFGVGPESIAEWKKQLGTTEKNSTDPGRVVQYLRELGLSAEPHQQMTIADLQQEWLAGHPVICAIGEYGVPSKKASFDYGHAVATVAVTAGFVIVQDPSISNVLAGEDADQAKGRMPISYAKWMQVWKDKDAKGDTLDRFGIIVGPKR